MARDLYTDLRRCHFCGRHAAIVWGDELFSCRHETCLALAFAEARRRVEAHGPTTVPIEGLEPAAPPLHCVRKRRRPLLA